MIGTGMLLANDPKLTVCSCVEQQRRHPVRITFEQSASVLLHHSQWLEPWWQQVLPGDVPIILDMKGTGLVGNDDMLGLSPKHIVMLPTAAGIFWLRTHAESCQ